MTPTLAHADMICKMTDTRGNNLVYFFQREAVTMHATDPGANGNIAGRFTERALSKNGVVVPVSGTPGWHWFYSAKDKVGVITQDSDPSWSIGVNTNGYAVLAHAPINHPLGTGNCQFNDVNYAPAPPPVYVPPPAPAPIIDTGRDDLDAMPEAARANHSIVISTTPSGAMLTRMRVGSSYVTALIDTGATSVSIPQSLAQGLVANGDATYQGEDTVTIADGSSRRQSLVKIKTIQLGSIVLHDVLATVAPDGADVLLGNSALDKLGRVTIDKAAGLLTFVRPGEEGYGE
jgi:clan AA aspartic protease (TIGR02281 family)